MEEFSYACCPGGDLRRLLEAALQPNQELALAAWREWRARHRLEDADLAMHRLMPVIYRRFKPPEMLEADHKILKGVHRFHWVRNQRQLQAVQAIAARLAEAGIETIALKGLALAFGEYADPGCRPMWDTDLLIAPEHRTRALEIFQQHGWSLPDYLQPLTVHHSCELKNGQGQEIDLHWYALDESRWAGVDDSFWSGSRPLGKRSLLTLSPEDSLLLICVHGLRRHSDVLGWVCDAHRVLSNHQNLDFSRLLESARQRRVVLFAWLALSYLRANFNLGIPEACLQELRQSRVSPSDRLYFWCNLRYHRVTNFFAVPLLDYWRTTTRPNPPGFARFLLGRWRLRSWQQAPAHALGRLWNRLIRRSER